jgi:hypothetical protein
VILSRRKNRAPPLSLSKAYLLGKALHIADCSVIKKT